MSQLERLREELDRASFGSMVPVLWQGKFWEVETDRSCTFWLETSMVSDAPDAAEMDEYKPEGADGNPWTWAQTEGWGAYLTMPGYLDRTELAVFETEAEAIEYLLEMAEEED